MFFLHGELGLALAFAVAVALGFAAGLVFRRSPAARRRARRDYGLLVPVATLPDRERADLLRERLRAAGIRGTLAPDSGPVRVSADGRIRPRGTMVLVFPADLARASALLPGDAEPPPASG